MVCYAEVNKEFKDEVVKLSDEVGLKQAAAQLGIVYSTRCRNGDRNAKLTVTTLLSAAAFVAMRR